MGQLIAFRALQGVGGGGLFAIALSIIGDVIPPRERGRYQGYFGAVFGVSSIAGPLLGGWLTDGPAGAGSSTSTCPSAWPRCSSPRRS
jgi:MFS family permease